MAIDLNSETEAFDAARSELKHGINLIEASAGTGKTYAIAMLVLRFVVERGLKIDELLVVTFTKAATEELKDRIRARLAEARQALGGTDAKIDVNLRAWLTGLPLDAEIVRQRLDLALLNIDQAAIFTIHGFCQRALAEHALESGQMFDCELSSDIAAIRQNCADDFWRKQIYRRPAWQVALLTLSFPTPDSLLASLGKLGKHQTVYPEVMDLDAALDELHTLIGTAAARLPDTLQTLQTAFEDGLFNASFIKMIGEQGKALTTWLADQNSGPADFSWLTGQGLQAGLNGNKFRTSKNNPLPGDQQKQQYLATLNIDCRPFENLDAALKKLQVNFRRALFEDLRELMNKALQQNNLMSFDDLITRLADALQGENGERLGGELRQRFGAALIDEFQDTDHQQWQIFSRIFALTPSSEHFLYLIGDPKQAIYKFRGADIFSYFAAQRQAQQQYTLTHNWRSHPDLVTAVNRLFKRSNPFLFENLSFLPVRAGRDFDDGRIGDDAPLVLWQLDKNPNGKTEHWTSGKANAEISHAVINEILKQLDQATSVETKHGSCPLKPKDIAILVRSNGQAADYQRALNDAGIPAVLNSKQSVFASPQALELHTVLEAIAQPGHIPALKQALTISWFNFDGQALFRLFTDDNREDKQGASAGPVTTGIGLDAWIDRFQDYHRLWQRQGLQTMMQQLFRQEGVEVHLGAQANAERVLTNLHHLVERLQQASIDEQLAINKTLDWLRRAILQSAQNSGDDQQLRLESDEDAVKIVTLHSSKGLEYPLVFCPSPWQRSDRLKSEKHLIQCHEDGSMIADFGSDNFVARRERAIYEELAEDLRLFYVAVTRAKLRCYIAWADVRTKEKANDSAMAYLLEFGDADFDGQRRILKSLAEDLPDAIQYSLLATDTGIAGRYRDGIGGKALTCRQRQRSLQSHWQMSSYTALSALSLHDVPEIPEDKAVEAGDVTAAEIPAVWTLATGGEEGSGLPKGAQTGNVVHSLLETVGFQRLAIGADIGQARDQALRRYGLNIDNPAMIDSLLQTVVHAPLSEDREFCLKNLLAECCLKEMPFYLAMQDIDVARINGILAASPSFQALSHKQMCGYLTGFIDLICQYRGQFFVMDYKTNSLPDYQPETLLQAMREHNYGLQYWLYTLVLDRYLRQRLPGYDYERHFGGVKYLFVRGMSATIPGAGIFSDRPDLKRIRQLGTMFFGETE